MVKIFSFYDERAQYFHPPFTAQNIVAVARTVHAMAEGNSDAPFIKYPKDFVLYEVGSWDDDIGRVEAVEPPERLQSAYELVHDLGAQLAT